MNLKWGYADDWTLMDYYDGQYKGHLPSLTVFLMHLLDLKGKLALQNNFIVKFVPLRERCEFWTREFGDWAEVQAMDCKADEIRGPEKEESDQKPDGRSC